MVSAASNNNANILTIATKVQEKNDDYKVYRKRWFMLFLFSLCSLCNSFHWIQYSVIANVITQFYGVDYYYVDWLSMIYMVVYVILVIPSTYFLDKKGLRWSIILGVLGTSIGGWIKVVSVTPDRFYVTFIGQGMAAVAQSFTFGIPPRLAAVWFGPGEISTACAIAVFGNQLGLALGFLIPPIMVPNSSDTSTVAFDLKLLFYVSSAFPSILFMLVLFLFQDAPDKPPSAARAAAIASASEGGTNYLKSLRRVVTNGNYILLLISYGFAIGVMTTVATLLNQIVLSQFPGHEEDVGTAGLSNVLCGLVGASILGFILDKTHKFKTTLIIICVLNILSMGGFTYSIQSGSMPLVYATMICLGLTMSAFLTLGFEYAAEMTYPEPEGTVGGLLNAAIYLSAIGFTNIGGWTLRTYGDLASNLFFTGILIAGLIFALLTKEDLRRQAAQNKAESDDSSPRKITDTIITNTTSEANKEYDTFP